MAASLATDRLCTRCQDEPAYESNAWGPACYRDWDQTRRGVSLRAVVCEFCGESFETYEKRYRRFCSRQCKSLNRRVQNYGLTGAQYDVLLAAQGGGCAICGAPSADVLNRRLSVDHDHATGDVRGLLCSACNSGIGHFRDNPALLRAAITYLQGEE